MNTVIPRISVTFGRNKESIDLEDSYRATIAGCLSCEMTEEMVRTELIQKHRLTRGQLDTIMATLYPAMAAAAV